MTKRAQRRKAEVVLLHAEGVAVEDIARRLTVSGNTVRRDLVDLGMLHPAPHKRDREVRRGRVRALSDEGRTPREIADELSVSEVTVYQDLRALGRPKGTKWDEGRRAAYRAVMAEKAAARRALLVVPVCACGGHRIVGQTFRYKGAVYCKEHLMQAGDYNPDYEREQRERHLRGVGRYGGRSSLANAE